MTLYSSFVKTINQNEINKLYYLKKKQSVCFVSHYYSLQFFHKTVTVYSYSLLQIFKPILKSWSQVKMLIITRS